MAGSVTRLPVSKMSFENVRVADRIGERQSSTGTAQGGADVKRNSERMQDQQEEEEQDE